MRALLLFLLLIPAPAMATIGFVEHSIWLSENHVREGETITIYAVLANDDSDPYTGTAHFADGEATIGSVPVSLDAGEATMISIPWEPKAGEHALAVRLDHTSAAIENTTEQLSVSVAPRPEDRDDRRDKKFTDSKGIQGAVLGVSTSTGTTIAPALAAIDTVRARTSSYLEQKSEEQKDKSAAATRSRDTLTTMDADDGKRRTLTFWTYFHKSLAALLSALSFMIAKAGLFYPLFAFLFLLTLWKLWRRFRMPTPL